MAWEGHTLAIDDIAEREQAIVHAVGLLTATADACRRAGLPVEIVSCGGTGTFRWTAKLPGITEIQAGGGIFGDLRYQQWGAGTELALTILTTVISRPTPTRIVVDAGLKTMSQYMPPQPLHLDGVCSLQLSAEHGCLDLDRPNTDLQVGDRLEFAVGYHDLTVFMHDYLYGIRDGIVETIWPVAGRGKLQ
jgi:D-serine deaminase-like pyridoxal phosphate-dependent protein